MKKFIIFLTILVIGMSACTPVNYEPHDCDLIFQVAETSDFSKAITDATAQKDDLKFDHVAIVFTRNEEVQVIEASAKKGVSILPFEAFVQSLPAGYVIKRVKNELVSSDILKNAFAHLGEPYDWSYLPGNGKMYCSELVYECFTDKDGQKLFQARPMNFRDENGIMPPFWIELFKKLGEEIPEGVLGTNPNDLSKEGVLEEVYRYLPVGHQSNTKSQE